MRSFFEAVDSFLEENQDNSKLVYWFWLCSVCHIEEGMRKRKLAKGWEGIDVEMKMTENGNLG